MLPKPLVDKFELPSSIVSIEPVKSLYDAEKNCDVKMAPKLNDMFFGLVSFIK